MKRLLAVLLAVMVAFSVSLTMVTAESDINKDDPYQPNPTVPTPTKPVPTTKPEPTTKPDPQQPEKMIVIRGDADMDGIVNVMDVTRIQRHIAELPIEALGELQSDVDGDEDITIMDATAIQRCLAEIANPYGIGERIATTALYLIREDYVTYVGGSTGILPVMKPADYDALSYSSSNSRVARVNSDGLVVGVSTGEATVTIRTTDGTDLSVEAHVKVMSSQSAAEKMDDYYDAMTPEWAQTVRQYVNSDSDLMALYLNNPKTLGYDTNSALAAEKYKHNSAVWEYINDGLTSKNYPFRDYSSEDALASMASTQDMNTGEMITNNTAAENYVKQIFAKIDAVTTVDGLLRLCGEIQAAGGATFLNMDTYPIYYPDEGYVYTKALFSADTVLDSFDDSYEVRAANTMIQGLFKQAGMSSTKAKNESSLVLSLTKKIADGTNAETDRIIAAAEGMEGDEADALYEEISGKSYTVDELQTVMPHLSVRSYLSYSGFSTGGRVYLDTPVQAKVIDRYLTAANLDALKAYLKYTVAIDALPFTTTGMKTMNAFYLSVYGATMSYDSFLSSMTDNALLWDYTKVVTQLFYPEEKKIAITAVCEEIKEAYAAEIAKCTWLSDETKAEMLDKLDCLQLNILYPDDFSPYVLPIDLKRKSQGATYFGNMVDISVGNRTRTIARDGVPLTKDDWMDFDTSSVNSYYLAPLNSLYILEGIVNEMTFSTAKSRVYNLSRVGYIAAHEMGHAFDPTGIVYDRDGRMHGSMTEEELKKYGKKQDQLIDVFDTFFVGSYGGSAFYEDGAFTLDENMSDLSAVETVLSMVSPAEYQKVFEGVASFWVNSDGFDYESYLDDEHATNKARINATFPMTDQFYLAYGAKPGDAMYVPPKYRVHIWD